MYMYVQSLCTVWNVHMYVCICTTFPHLLLGVQNSIDVLHPSTPGVFVAGLEYAAKAVFRREGETEGIGNDCLHLAIESLCRISYSYGQKDGEAGENERREER